MRCCVSLFSLGGGLCRKTAKRNKAKGWNSGLLWIKPLVVMNNPEAKVLTEVFEGIGCDRWGWVPLQRPLSMDIYESWIERGQHGTMDYLKSHMHLKAHPKEIRPRVQSAFVFAIPYYPHPWPLEKDMPKTGVALYAQGRDYHIQIKSRLRKACEKLKDLYPGHDFYVFTDSAPVLERDLAYRAGLGWFGKNTCLIDREAGSLFHIAEILTSLESPEQAPSLSHDFCGRCTKCIEICPTSALSENRSLDATKCISYWTIESAEPAREELRSKFGGWVFGCDLCQTVCPWNIKLHGPNLTKLPSRSDYVEDLGWILRTTSKQLQIQLRATPLARAAGIKLKRNAMIAAANERLHELAEDIKPYLDHPNLSEVARWALRILESSEKVGTLGEEI
jgi:epoxyqueuosine reductase